MNAPTINDLRNALPARDLADEKMLQVRDLLMGDFMRECQARMLALETRIRDLESGLAQRVRDLEIGVGQRLSELNVRIETLSADHTVDRQSAFDELSKCVLDLGDKIRAISR